MVIYMVSTLNLLFKTDMDRFEEIMNQPLVKGQVGETQYVKLEE